LVESGTDVTIVTLGAMRGTTVDAVADAAWSADVIDLRTLIPWDKEAVLSSVAKTGRLAIVEESPFSGGWGTEIASYVASHAFGDLTAPVTRITCPDVPVPFGRDLEQRYLPSAEYVRTQIGTLIETGSLPIHWWEQEVSR
jgi:pyruvate/2-oxoglutarate/acetoin dehydrogenase E1 component